MSYTALVMLAIALITAIYTVVIYNGLVGLKHNVTKALANIDVLLKQRHDELPKLIETCKQYMTYEQQTLENIINARGRVAYAQKQGDIDALGKAETLMRASLGQLFALAENYPKLQADQSFAHLHQRISNLESSIADRREVYNESVNNNNVRIEQFPDVIVAKLFSFRAFKLLKFATTELKDVDLKKLFNDR